jgi:hypothetical protein
VIRNTKLKWETWEIPLKTKTRSSVAEKLGMTALNDFLQTKKIGYTDFQFKEDWAKVIHLWDNKFFVTGGSSTMENMDPWMQQQMGQQKYSNKAFVIDTGTGVVTEKPNMHFKR